MSRHLIVCSTRAALVEDIARAMPRAPRVTLLDSSLQVLAAVQADGADLLVLDLDTPGLNPLLLTSAVRALAPALPILAVSSRPPEDERALSHKGVSHVALPPERTARQRVLAAALDAAGPGCLADRFGLPANVGSR